MADCIDILKTNLMNIADDQKDEIQDILSLEIEIPPTGTFDIDEDVDSFNIDDYMTDETRKRLGL